MPQLLEFQCACEPLVVCSPSHGLVPPLDITKLKVHTPGLVTELAGTTVVFIFTDPVFADPQSMRLLDLCEHFQIFFPADLW